MSWESTQLYYQIINRYMQQALGGVNSAKIVLHSVNFAEIEALQRSGQWHEAGEVLAQAAAGLELAGADLLLLCTNTMHKIAAQIEQRVDIPLLHIADPTAQALCADSVEQVALLGTAFTMEQAFYKNRLRDKYGLQVLLPDEQQRKQVHRIIYDELCQGKIIDSSRQIYINIAEELRNKGAQAIILGCTEITMLLTPADTTVPLYDTTRLHAEAAARMALKN
ncbi:MAG: aspartate/glutamate racemase family protein [Enterobacteriaceae bacterium]